MRYKIIVTGAFGFIGSCMVRYLNDRGYTDLILVDDVTKEDKWQNLVGKRFIDIISKRDIFSYLNEGERKIDAFIHLGACTNTMEEDMGYLLENNYRFSKRLAEYCFAHGCRFIYASSAATYGDGSRGFLDDEGGLYDLQSINRYAYSKHLFDLWLSKEGLFNKVAGFKFFNVFGPNEWHKGMMASMIYHMTKTIQKEGEVRLFKSTDIKYQDGEQKRDFIYVKDVVKILGDFLDNDICGIFNLGRGEAVSWNSVASAIFKALGKVENIRYIDMPASLVNGYQNYTCADMSKYFKVVGKHDMWSLDKAIDDYVKNYILMDKLW